MASKGTSDFLADLAKRKKKGGGSEPERIEVSDVELLPTEDQVNSGDRAEAEKPGPPPAKKVGGDWVQPIWNEAAWEWQYPEGTVEKEKTEAKKGASGKRGSAADILANVRKKKQEAKAERIEEPSEAGPSEAGPSDPETEVRTAFASAALEAQGQPEEIAAVRWADQDADSTVVELVRTARSLLETAEQLIARLKK